MAYMNNWLGFSLSPQELPPSQPHQTHQSPTIISGADDVPTDCYGISTDSSSAPPLAIPTLRPDGSFGILEALNRPNHQSQDWSMKGLDYKASPSELSMLVGSGTSQNNMEEDEPKLEDFLGGNSFSDQDHQKLPPGCSSISESYNNPGDYIFSNCSLQLPAAAAASRNGGLMNNSGGGGGNNNSSSLGLSMIKSWLRNQPGPPQQPESQSRDTAGTSGGANNGGPSGQVENAGGHQLASSQGLSLSMSTGSQSSSPLPLVAAAANGGGECSSSDNKQKGTAGSGLDAQSGAIEVVPRKSIDTFGQRTSIYRGVTRHRWTGRYEAHLWDNSCRREGQTRKGRQVYLGGYDKEEKAARAYDLAALKYWGPTTTTNFPVSNYEKELEEMKHMTRQEYVASLRRKSSGFSRGASIYRGVTRHHQHGRWQARIGRVAGNKDLYLGTFSTQEEAAEAYDIAAIKFRGLNAVTNFDMSRYDVQSILESSTLPIGGAAKRLKDVSESTEMSVDVGRRADVDDSNITSQLADGIGGYGSHHHHHHHNSWPTIAFQQAPQPLAMHYPYGPQQQQQQRGGWPCKQEQDTGSMHGLQDLQQLHLGAGNTHNFFQPSVYHHNLMSLDSASMEHGTGSNSVVYNGGVNVLGTSSGSYQGAVGGNGGFMMPISTMVVNQGQSHQASSSSYGETEGKQVGYENILAGGDPYGGRNVYYLPPPSAGSIVKENGYEQGSSNTWIPTPAQAIAPRTSNVAVAHGAPLFTVWNDA